MKTANIENGLDSQVGMIWEKRAHVLLSEEEIERRVSKAFAMLLHKDRYLLNVQVNERSLTHRFGIYLQEVFPEYDVDCEYNRDLTVPKRFQEKRERDDKDEPVPRDDKEGRTVFPDIIVHRRGDRRSNLLVIEVEKSTSKLDCSEDIDKIEQYKEQLGYKHGLFVVVPTGAKSKPKPELKWLWDR